MESPFSKNVGSVVERTGACLIRRLVVSDHSAPIGESLILVTQMKVQNAAIVDHRSLYWRSRTVPYCIVVARRRLSVVLLREEEDVAQVQFSAGEGHLEARLSGIRESESFKFLEEFGYSGIIASVHNPNQIRNQPSPLEACVCRFAR